MVEIIEDFPQAGKDQSTEYSTHLMIIFYLATLCVPLELLSESYRLNFLGILILLQIYFFLFIGYYNSKAVWMLLLQLAASIIFDTVYISLITFAKIDIMPFRYTGNDVYFYFCFYFLILQTITKSILLCQLFQYRNIKKD